MRTIFDVNEVVWNTKFMDNSLNKNKNYKPNLKCILSKRLGFKN